MNAPAHSLHAPLTAAALQQRPHACDLHHRTTPSPDTSVSYYNTSIDHRPRRTTPLDKTMSQKQRPEHPFYPSFVVKNGFPNEPAKPAKGKRRKRTVTVLPYVTVVPVRPLSDGMTALEKSQVYYAPHEMRALYTSAKEFQRKVLAIAPDLTAEACLEIDGLRGVEAAVSPEILRNRAMAVRAVILWQRKLRILSDRGKDRNGVGDDSGGNATISIADPAVSDVWTERKVELLAGVSTKATRWAGDVARERGRRNFWWAYPDKAEAVVMLGQGEGVVARGITLTAKYGVGGEEGGELVPTAIKPFASLFNNGEPRKRRTSASATDSGDRSRDGWREKKRKTL